MKKFIVFVISLLFLAVFLMMNYFIWDQDNLLQMQEDSEAQQAWLRGQNRTLTDTISELEDIVNALENDISRLTEQTGNLQRQVITTTGREAELRRTLDGNRQKLDMLRTASLPILKDIFSSWMLAVNENRSADSYLSFSPDFRFMMQAFTREKYQAFLDANIYSIQFSLPEGETSTSSAEPMPAEPLFERIGNEADDLTVLVRTQVLIAHEPEATEDPDVFNEGLNSLELQFIYDTINRKWYIQSILPGT